MSILGPGRLVRTRGRRPRRGPKSSQPPTSLLDPRNLLIGRLPVTATGVLHDRQRRRAVLARVGGVGGMPMPKAVLQEIVSYYSRTPEKPGGTQPRRSVRSCRRTFARFKSTAVRPSSFNERDRRGARDAPSVSEGGRASPRGGFRARRPASRSRICSIAFRFATKIAAGCSRSRRSSRRAPRPWPAGCSAAASARRGVPASRFSTRSIDDGTASIRVSWLNQAFLRDVFSRGPARRPVRAGRDARAAAACS